MTCKQVLGVVCLLSMLLATGVTAQESPVQAEPELPSQGEPAAVASVLRLIRFSGATRSQPGQPLAGTVGVTFALYADQEGGAPLWLETQNAELDQQGRYTVLLGATQSEGLPLELFTSGEARWLGIQVQGQPEQARVLLVSVPYALRAEEAQRLAGREASEFLLAEQMESDVQGVVETKVVEELEAQGLVATEDGVTRTITDGASTFTDNNATQVVEVTQQGTGKAVKATSTSGNTIEAESTGTGGTNFTLLGINRSNGGRALFGFASATSGPTIAAAGRADSPLGIGFFGQALSVTGPTVAVQGEVRSPNGIAGLFANTAGGKLLSGKSAGTEVFSVDGNGTIETDGSAHLDGNIGIGINSPLGRLHIQDLNVTPELWVEGAPNSDAITPTIKLHEGTNNTICGFQFRYFGSSNQLRIASGCPTLTTNIAINRSSGEVGIGTESPADLLHVAGDIRVGTGSTGCVKDADATVIAGTCSSDIRLKTNIQPFAPVLDKIVQLRPVRFDWRGDEFPEFHFGRARSFGLIAQDVETVLPELVTRDEEGFKAIRYNLLPFLMLQAIRELKAEKDNQELQTTLLLEAVKEQHAQIRTLQSELETVKAQLNRSDDNQVAVLNLQE